MSFTRTKSIIYDPIVSASPDYQSGDAIGDLQSFALPAPGQGVLKDVVVEDKANQKPPLTILIFDSQPTGLAADNAAFVLTDADLLKIKAKINVAAADYETIGGKAVAHIETSKAIKGDDDRKIWVAMLTTGTPNLASTSDLRVKLGCILDK